MSFKFKTKMFLDKKNVNSSKWKESLEETKTREFVVNNTRKKLTDYIRNTVGEDLKAEYNEDRTGIVVRSLKAVDVYKDSKIYPRLNISIEGADNSELDILLLILKA